jgi:outer membrane protein TolC
VGLKIAELGQEQRLMKLQLDAVKSYTSWLASGWILAMEQQRLTLLEQRQTGLKARMDAGDFSRLEFLDASRQYKEQKAQVLAAKQGFFAASAKLGQYWRDEDGRVQPIPDTMLPPRFHTPIVATAWTPQSLERALKAQPKVRILGLKRQALNMKIALAQEQIRPQLSFAPEFIQTLGEGAFDTKQKENELALGVNFMMYLGQDKARGKLQELQAKRVATRLKQRQAQDVVRVKLLTHLNALQLAIPRFTLRKEAMDLAIQVAAMEREKLTLGAQDIFKVNAREEKAIDAQIKTIKLYKDVLYHQMALDIMTKGQTP